MTHETAQKVADTLHRAGMDALVISSRGGYSVAAESPHHIWWALGRLGRGCTATLDHQFGIWPWSPEDDEGHEESAQAALLIRI